MKLSIGFSPCPNDTFIFDALINKKIDTEGIEFSPVLEDVETLNQWTLDQKLDITKLSFPAFFQSTDHYILLQSGSALGKGVGPLLVSRKADVRIADVPSLTVALPGVNTTAHLLFGFAFPAATHKKFMLFSSIEDAVVNQEADLGVIIHENRFTYAAKGLHKVLDLGEYWEEKMHVPIPLGGIAIRRTIEPAMQQTVDRLIHRSLQYAFSKYPFISDYVRQHSQAMEEDVMRRHIDLYVNDYSLALGEDGKHAIRELQKVYRRASGDDGKTQSDNLFR